MSKQFTIREEDGQYCLYAKKSGKKLGCHDSREDALAQERAIRVRKAGALLAVDPKILGDAIAQAAREEKFFDPEDDDRKPSRTYMSALLAGLRKNLKGVSRETFAAAMRRARAHAGGVMRSRKAKRSAKGGKKAYDPYPESSGPKFAKDDAIVSFEAGGGEAEERCGTCRFFSPGSCRMVEGTVEQGDLCKLWRDRIDFSFDEPEDLYPLCASEAGEGGTHERGEWALFVPFHGAEAGESEWMPYLPIPGTYEHPKYGAIVITPERNERFVKNFETAIYQQSIPIDAEHDLKVSGALGYVEEMRMNADGSVDAKVRWTDRGAEMVEADRFRYVSPEWYDEWTDPMSGQVYQDVAIGGALTTRPFFKEKALRPLVAEKEHVELWFGEGVESVRFERRERNAGRKEESDMAEKVKAKKSASEEKPSGLLAKLRELLGGDAKDEDIRAELKELTASEQDDQDDVVDQKPPISKSAAERIQALEKRAHAAEERAESAEAKSVELTERLASLEKEAQRKRLRDIVMGRAPGSSNRWFGDETKNVDRLVALAEKLGETSDEFKAVVAREIAHANQLHSVSFQEHGTVFGAEEESAAAKIEAAAKKLMESDPKNYSTIEQAKVEVVRRDPALKRQYREEQQRQSR